MRLDESNSGSLTDCRLRHLVKKSKKKLQRLASCGSFLRYQSGIGCCISSSKSYWTSKCLS
eukprot:3314188-Amphidinium_carterae.2